MRRHPKTETPQSTARSSVAASSRRSVKLRVADTTRRHIRRVRSTLVGVNTPAPTTLFRSLSLSEAQ